MIAILLFQNLESELQKYLNSLFSTQSPIFIAMLILFVLLIILHTFYQYIYKPLKEKHYKEKQEAELKQAKMLALFSERNPDPILRISLDGKVIGFNESAKEIISLNGEDVFFSDILPHVKLNYSQSIKNNEEYKFTFKKDNQTFDVLYTGMDELDFAQVYFHDITEREEYENQLTEYQYKVSGLVNELETQLETERNRISKDLHDSICQSIVMANMRIQKLENNDANVKTELTQVEDILRGAVDELRSIIKDLKPLDLEKLGLKGGIISAVNKITEHTDLVRTLNIENLPDEIDEKIELTIFRVVQETVANIIKHSKASKFEVELFHEENGFTLIVSDNGTGFETKRLKNGRFVSSGNGIVNIQERVAFAGGDLDIDSSPGQGTVIIVNLPLKIKEEI